MPVFKHLLERMIFHRTFQAANITIEDDEKDLIKFSDGVFRLEDYLPPPHSQGQKRAIDNVQAAAPNEPTGSSLAKRSNGSHQKLNTGTPVRNDVVTPVRSSTPGIVELLWKRHRRTSSEARYPVRPWLNRDGGSVWTSTTASDPIAPAQIPSRITERRISGEGAAASCTQNSCSSTVVSHQSAVSSRGDHDSIADGEHSQGEMRSGNRSTQQEVSKTSSSHQLHSPSSHLHPVLGSSDTVKKTVTVAKRVEENNASPENAHASTDPTAAHHGESPSLASSSNGLDNDAFRHFPPYWGLNFSFANNPVIHPPPPPGFFIPRNLSSIHTSPPSAFLPSLGNVEQLTMEERESPNPRGTAAMWSSWGSPWRDYHECIKRVRRARYGYRDPFLLKGMASGFSEHGLTSITMAVPFVLGGGLGVTLWVVIMIIMYGSDFSFYAILRNKTTVSDSPVETRKKRRQQRTQHTDI